VTGLVTSRAITPRFPAVTLRHATADDCEPIWNWSFAPNGHARSKLSDMVAFADHVRWFERRLADPHDPIWVIETLAGPVGVVRLDTVGSGLARISIALAATSRGHGIGRHAISAVCQRWGRPIFAEILSDNLVSRACFEACGFRSVVECDGLLTYHWDPEIR
jgi:RimJ/RimL family protein N-acetyltransferase